jgi:serine/threonine protein kinase
MIGKSLGPYRILGSLSHSAVGEAYVAEDPERGSEVVVKFLPDELQAKRGLLSRFKAALRSYAALSHPDPDAIGRIHEADGQTFLVLEREHAEELLPIIEEFEAQITGRSATTTLGGTSSATTQAARYLTATLTPGLILGDRYRITSQLGRGGVGEVWRAFDLKLRVDVALKSLRRDRFADAQTLELLRSEVRARVVKILSRATTPGCR